MKKYTVIIYETFRYEIPVEAENRADAADQVDDIFLRLENQDPDYYETEVIDIIEIKEQI